MVGSVRSKGPTLTFLVKGAFSLAPGALAEALEEPAFPQGDQFYEDDPEEQGAPRYSSDFVPFKPAADLLVVGSCWAPRRGERQCVARVRCGRVEASLLVTGDREWSSGLLGGSASEAESFERIELRYENSYGGEGFAANPRGKGASAIEIDGRKRRPMPNLMDPERPVASLRGKHKPVGFGPTSTNWEPRSGMLGTFDDAWLEKRWPWLPEDVDWRYFNAAPEALQVQGYLNGDEEISLENLHPDHRIYDFSLPAIQPRLFVDDRERGYGEVALELDTCWIDMDAEQLVLVWRGVRPVADEFFDELVGLHLVQESMADEPGDVSGYERKYREGDRKPAPPPVEGPTPAERLAEKRARAEAEQARALSAAGVEIPAQRERTEEELADEARLLEVYGVKLPETPPEFTRGDVEALARAGESLAGRDLTGLVLDGIDLSGADLKGALLRGVPLGEANLSRRRSQRCGVGRGPVARRGAHRVQARWRRPRRCLPRRRGPERGLPRRGLVQSRQHAGGPDGSVSGGGGHLCRLHPRRVLRARCGLFRRGLLHSLPGRSPLVAFDAGRDPIQRSASPGE